MKSPTLRKHSNSTSGVTMAVRHIKQVPDITNELTREKKNNNKNRQLLRKKNCFFPIIISRLKIKKKRKILFSAVTVAPEEPDLL